MFLLLLQWLLFLLLLLPLCVHWWWREGERPAHTLDEPLHVMNKGVEAVTKEQLQHELSDDGVVKVRERQSRG